MSTRTGDFEGFASPRLAAVSLGHKQAPQQPQESTRKQQGQTPNFQGFFEISQISGKRRNERVKSRERVRGSEVEEGEGFSRWVAGQQGSRGVGQGFHGRGRGRGRWWASQTERGERGGGCGLGGGGWRAGRCNGGRDGAEQREGGWGSHGQGKEGKKERKRKGFIKRVCFKIRAGWDPVA